MLEGVVVYVVGDESFGGDIILVGKVCIEIVGVVEVCVEVV